MPSSHATLIAYFCWVGVVALTVHDAFGVASRASEGMSQLAGPLVAPELFRTVADLTASSFASSADDTSAAARDKKGKKRRKKGNKKSKKSATLVGEEGEARPSDSMQTLKADVESAAAAPAGQPDGLLARAKARGAIQAMSQHQSAQPQSPPGADAAGTSAPSSEQHSKQGGGWMTNMMARSVSARADRMLRSMTMVERAVAIGVERCVDAALTYFTPAAAAAPSTAANAQVGAQTAAPATGGGRRLILGQTPATFARNVAPVIVLACGFLFFVVASVFLTALRVIAGDHTLAQVVAGYALGSVAAYGAAVTEHFVWNVNAPDHPEVYQDLWVYTGVALGLAFAAVVLCKKKKRRATTALPLPLDANSLSPGSYVPAADEVSAAAVGAEAEAEGVAEMGDGVLATPPVAAAAPVPATRLVAEDLAF
jgi:hypothetical protein